MMKKALLSIGIVFAATMAQAQIATYVLEPPSLEGSLDFTWADNWGQTPDLNDPANLVEGSAVLVDDGTAADSLGCEVLVNNAAISGNIAVVYRGTCEFGAKALNAQNAGAIAVVIINNAPGSPVGMGAGAQGGNVTIPVVMISQADGAALRPEIDNGTVVLRIGSVLGLFPNDLSVAKADASLSQFSAIPTVLAATDTEFAVALGSFINNYGSADQDGVTLNCVVTQDGNEVYNETSDPASIPSAGSVFFTLPTFSQDGYSGYYEVTYTAIGLNPDDFPASNTYTFNFLVDSLFAYANIDPVAKTPVPQNHYRPVDAADTWASCMHFQNANASRALVEGLYTSASKAAGASMDGEVLEIYALEWNDVFDTYTNATFTNISTLTSADYFYTEDLGSEVIYIPFLEPVYMEDNKRYLFCVYTPNAEVFIGYDETRDYTLMEQSVDQPISLIQFPFPGGEWGDFGPDVVSAIGARMVSIEVGIEDRDRVEITPYPNPTADIVRIPTRGMTGAAQLEVFDMSGSKVAEKRVSVGSDQIMEVNVNDISNGTYLFKLNFENGKYSNFRVVVTK